jgi:hypothetical protein
VATISAALPNLYISQGISLPQIIGNIIAAAGLNSFFGILCLLKLGWGGEKQSSKNTKEIMLTRRCNDIPNDLWQ